MMGENDGGRMEGENDEAPIPYPAHDQCMISYGEVMGRTLIRPKWSPL